MPHDLLHRLLRPVRRVATAPRSVERDSLVVELPDGRIVDVRRHRDPRARRLKLSVDERGARLTQPPRMSLVAGERFLKEHGAWLQAQLDRHAPDHAAALPLVAGETRSLPLRGREVPLEWAPGRFTHLVARPDGTLLFHVPARAGDAALKRALREFYEAEARADVGRWLPRYLATLPRAHTRLRLKVMTSQWGSLAPDGSLALDLALVLGAPAAFEYVLVHELCHLLQPNHSPAFWAEVEARFPAWRDQRAYFHRDGRGLKARLRGLIA